MMITFFRKLFFALFIFLAIPAFHLSAATDQVQINLSVTGSADTTAPSIPAGLSATPVSTSQIDLSWTASTDNVGVSGYQVFRDNSQIATSTGTTYSDTGLSAATTYSYNVTAFDVALNISARSATSTATTNSAPATPSTPGSGGGTFFPEAVAPFIDNVVVSPGITLAAISWSTDEPALSKLSWGLTPDYELGSLSEAVFSTSHQTTLTNLSPGTIYYFKIDAQDSSGNSSGVGGFRFLTLVPPDDTPPSNVRNLTANIKPGSTDDSVLLTWENPLDPDFEAVRVLRGRSFYPSDPFDGELIYDGPLTDAIDITNKDATFFYTVFTRDELGNYSSGAIVRPVRPGTDPFDPGEIIEDKDVHPEIGRLSILDFDFIQENSKVVFSGGAIDIDSSRGLKISVDYDKVPNVLKAITITLVDPDDASKRFSFLLRVNANKTAYEASVAPLGKSGRYPIYITIFDFKNQGVKRIEGELVAELVVVFRGSSQRPGNSNLLWIFIIVLIFYIWYLRIVRKRGY